MYRVDFGLTPGRRNGMCTKSCDSGEKERKFLFAYSSEIIESSNRPAGGDEGRQTMSSTSHTIYLIFRLTRMPSLKNDSSGSRRQ